MNLDYHYHKNNDLTQRWPVNQAREFPRDLFWDTLYKIPRACEKLRDLSKNQFHKIVNFLHWSKDVWSVENAILDKRFVWNPGKKVNHLPTEMTTRVKLSYIFVKVFTCIC